MKQAELTQEIGVIPRLWENRGVRIAFEVMMIAGLSALAAVAKKFDPALGIPGSGGIYWLIPMVILRSVVKRDGAGFVIGVAIAAWAIPLGGLKQEHTFMYNALLYGGAGVMMDLVARLPRVNIGHPLGAMLCGFSAHMVKEGFVIYAALASNVTTHFMMVGLLNSILLHAGIGFASGLIGWGAVKAGRSSLRQLP